MDIDAYLLRIDYHGSREPTAETLRHLHRAHMLTVPFENLDITLGQPITLSLQAFYDKVVRRGRGGFCYELNGLFGWLLEQLGFSVTLLSARVCNGSQPGPEFDHMVLLVDLKEPLIADVGFGDSFVEPLRLDHAGEHLQRGSTYRLVEQNPEWSLQQKREARWQPEFVFSLTPRRLTDFGAMCHHQQTSPDSAFTRKTICSRATPKGRVTLSNGRLIETKGEGREERAVATAAEYRALLSSRFGIDLGSDMAVERLMERHPSP